ncbi:hypothetical protein [Dechloromonas agitata]|uniref:hypothetical protein n=1 Tax=Dechloromonas agitata TaxID=73030 RepID=UPI0018DF0D5E|nr:hypothetical protein [Dechloromonas agitata]
MGRSLDVDNIAKTIIDSFCLSQIDSDGSSFTELGLHLDDTFAHVRILQVLGGRSETTDSTLIEIFACVQDCKYYPFSHLVRETELLFKAASRYIG